MNIVRDVGRVGEPLKWDPAAERFTNCDEANKLLIAPRRKGYELPAISAEGDTDRNAAIDRSPLPPKRERGRG